MTTTRIYASTDASAPVLTGAVASLLNLLDKCLVDGYGSKTAAGWARAFVGTNVTAYRNSMAVGGSGMHIRVDDTGGGTGGAREALCRTYLTMSDVDTGTIETPTVAQLAASIVFRKSNTVDSTARAWSMVADERGFYLTINDGFADCTMAAGDFVSYVPGDPYAFFIAGRETQSGANSYGTGYGLFYRAGNFNTPTASGLYVARGFAGTGSPIAAAVPMLAATSGGSGSAIGGAGGIANPAPGSGLSQWLPAFIVNEGTLRGQLPGLHVSINNFTGVAAGAEYPDPPGAPSGAVLVTLRCRVSGNGGDDGHVFVDRVTPWW